MRVNLGVQSFYAGKNIIPVNRTDIQKVNFGNSNEISPEQKLAKTRGVYEHGLKNKYAIPAFNFSNLENLKSIIAGAKGQNSPLIVQVSAGARKYAGQDYLLSMVKAAKADAGNIPVMLHLDHGEDFEICKSCVDGGFDSVMIDGSKHSLEDNIKLTKQVVDYAHSKGVFVEAELGKLAGVEDNISSKESLYTNPQEAAKFVKETGCDSLAISIGTSHGPVKFGPNDKPKLDFKRLSEIKKAVEAILPENQGKKPSDPTWRQYPFVLHGASSAPQDLVDKINANIVIPREKYEKLETSINNLINHTDGVIAVWKKMEAIEPHKAKVIGKGVPEEMYNEATKRGITKVNVDTDFRLAYTATVKQTLADKPVTIDPRDYGKLVQANLTEIAKRKTDMLNSTGQALNIKA